MTVSDLINLLKKEDPNANIVVSTFLSNGKFDSEFWYELSYIEGFSNTHVFLNCRKEFKF